MAHPSAFTLRRNALFAAFGKIGQNNLSLIAAGVAFFSMLSLFPALAALIAVLSLVADPEVVVVQLEEMREVVPEDVYEILYGQITGLVNTSSDTLGWTGATTLLLAVWSARSGVGAMMHGMNVVYEVWARATLRHYLRAYFLTIGLVTVGVISLLALVIAPVVLAFFDLGGFTYVAIDALRWTTAILVIFLGIGLLYRFGPNRRPQVTRFLTPGSLLAVISWVGVSFGFSYYVSNFGNYNEVYGSIGAVIAMLIWLWISSFLVLLGASWNAEIEKILSLENPPGADTPPPEPQEAAPIA